MATAEKPRARRQQFTPAALKGVAESLRRQAAEIEAIATQMRADGKKAIEIDGAMKAEAGARLIGVFIAKAKVGVAR